MNEKLQYATMLDIPVNTCNVTFKPTKKRTKSKKKVVNPDSVKEELMQKINSQEQAENAYADTYAADDSYSAYYNSSYNQSETDYQESTNDKTEKKPFRFSAVGIQLAIIGVLIATIFLTNAFYVDSGINVFMREVFGGDETPVQTIDDRTYEQFAPVIAVGEDATVSIEDGIISFTGTGSVYAPCDGKVTSVSRDGNGKYTIEIAHSENFKSTLTGIDYAYAGVDDEVYYNIPVGYVSEEGITMCFTGADGSIISDYEIVDNSVVWAV